MGRHPTHETGYRTAARCVTANTDSNFLTYLLTTVIVVVVDISSFFLTVASFPA